MLDNEFMADVVGLVYDEIYRLYEIDLRYVPDDFHLDKKLIVALSQAMTGAARRCSAMTHT